jgi:hypothetical protein
MKASPPEINSYFVKYFCLIFVSQYNNEQSDGTIKIDGQKPLG